MPRHRKKFGTNINKLPIVKSIDKLLVIKNVESVVCAFLTFGEMNNLSRCSKRCSPIKNKYILKQNFLSKYYLPETPDDISYIKKNQLIINNLKKGRYKKSLKLYPDALPQGCTTIWQSRCWEDENFGHINGNSVYYHNKKFDFNDEISMIGIHDSTLYVLLVTGTMYRQNEEKRNVISTDVFGGFLDKKKLYIVSIDKGWIKCYCDEEKKIIKHVDNKKLIRTFYYRQLAKTSTHLVCLIDNKTLISINKDTFEYKEIEKQYITEVEALFDNYIIVKRYDSPKLIVYNGNLQEINYLDFDQSLSQHHLNITNNILIFHVPNKDHQLAFYTIDKNFRAKSICQREINSPAPIRQLVIMYGVIHMCDMGRSYDLIDFTI